MGVSLGVRISALCVVGALAIGTAAACGGGDGDDASGSSGGGNGGSTSAAGGTSDGRQDGGGTGNTGGSGSTGGTGGSTSGGMPTWQAPDGDGGSGTSGSGSSRGSGGSGTSGGSGGSNGSNGSSGSGSSSGGGGSIEGPAWLPPGPHSPNTDDSFDPEAIYDLLGEKPESCADTAKKIPADFSTADWQVVRGLAEACKAVQGQGGDWNLAASDYSALQGELTSCKGKAAYAALGRVLRFHQNRPSATVKLKASTPGGGGAVCEFVIVSVDVGEDGKAKLGETITIKLAGMYFNKTELLSGSGVVTVAGVQVFNDEGPDYDAEPPDELTFKVNAPALAAGADPQSADVTVEFFEGKATKKNAFTLVAPDPSPNDSPVTSPEVSPATSTGAARSR